MITGYVHLRYRGIVNTFGVYQAFYEKNILNNETSSNIAWIGSLQAFLLLTVGVLTGPLFDKGYVKWNWREPRQ